MPVPSVLKDAAFRIVTAVKGNPAGLVNLPVMGGPGKGLRLELDLVRRRESAYFLGKYERDILATLSGVVKPGWTVWDIGTYLGFYSVFFSRLAGPTGTVVSIEPDPRNLERTKRNLELNGFQSRYSVPAAIGAPLGEIEFLLSDDTNSHLPGAYVGNQARKEAYRESDRSRTAIRIPCISLDQARFEWNLPVPHLVKIDIEGAELQALRHLDRLVGEARPLLLLELHNPECDAEAWAFAQRLDYALHRAEDRKVLNSAGEVCGTLLCVPRESSLSA